MKCSLICSILTSPGTVQVGRASSGFKPASSPRHHCSRKILGGHDAALGNAHLRGVGDLGWLERHLRPPKVEPLSQAALETLSIVAYEQPVTRADIRGIRGVDGDAVVETLLARGLIAEDPRFGGRGRPTFLVTTPIFLRSMGLASLAELPPRPAPAR